MNVSAAQVFYLAPWLHQLNGVISETMPQPATLKTTAVALNRFPCDSNYEK